MIFYFCIFWCLCCIVSYENKKLIFWKYNGRYHVVSAMRISGALDFDATWLEMRVCGTIDSAWWIWMNWMNAWPQNEFEPKRNLIAYSPKWYKIMWSFLWYTKKSDAILSPFFVTSLITLWTCLFFHYFQLINLSL